MIIQKTQGNTPMKILGTTALAGALLAASFTLAPAPAMAGKADDTLNAAFALEPEALDTYKIAGREGLILARHIYDGLLYKDLDSTLLTSLTSATKKLQF